jgi:hypothetical protein
MAAEKDAGLIEVILLRQHPNHTLPAIVQTSVQRKIRRRLLSPTKSRWTVTHGVSQWAAHSAGLRKPPGVDTTYGD